MKVIQHSSLVNSYRLHHSFSYNTCNLVHCRSSPHKKAEHFWVEPRLGRARQRLGCQAAAADVRTKENPVQNQFEQLKRWLVHTQGLTQQQLKLELSAGLYSSTEDFRVNQLVKVGEVLLELPAELGITATDAHSNPGLTELTEGRSELVCLALWLIAERAKGTASTWHPFLQSLPDETESPILWSDAERKQLLRGSLVAEEAAARAAALELEWDSIEGMVQSSLDKYPLGTFTRSAFMKAMSVVFAHAAFLDSAQCFALLPVATLLRRTGREDAAPLDFDLDRQTAVLIAGRSYGIGEVAAIYDGRPNGELFLATGTVEDKNPADCLMLYASLVKADRLFSAKKSILESVGFSEVQEFPIYEDRMPLQLLAYFRLSRVQDPAELAMVSFDRDAIISQNNEYEILQLMMGDCRDRLSAYPGSIEEDVKKLQRRDLTDRERVATRLLLSEQRILQGTIDAIRRRLAPIRGIPTKSGRMADPNEDLRDIFQTIESIPQAPAKLLGGIMSWARGEQDPTWKKKKKSVKRW